MAAGKTSLRLLFFGTCIKDCVRVQFEFYHAHLPELIRDAPLIVPDSVFDWSTWATAEYANANKMNANVRLMLSTIFGYYFCYARVNIRLFLQLSY